MNRLPRNGIPLFSRIVAPLFTAGKSPEIQYYNKFMHAADEPGAVTLAGQTGEAGRLDRTCAMVSARA